jgi:DNA-binding PadR family transcriptional regulator
MPMDNDELREATFLILASLAAAPQHGYAVMRDVVAASNGRVELSAGTVYAALDRLSHGGLIDASGVEVVNGRNRRYYQLTDRGEARLRAEIERWRANTAHASDRLILRAADGGR